ncbi:TraR/DksA family transcriptional regulator [Aliivibrio fischeri]|uniref:TraR/DksA family transcriptional regulator n=1 Tax=Aliivibrio fischeri TaxID=668 RepID=UPI0007C4E447|nr:TraR/DksA family transcriptional regulator [Aliivibrio fischeri]
MIHVAEILLERKNAILLSIESGQNQLKNFEKQIESGDVTSDEMERTRISGELDRKKSQLRSLDVAMQLIQEDRYGFCLVCGDEIAKLRLINNPEVTECIDCKAKLEQKKKHMRH